MPIIYVHGVNTRSHDHFIPIHEFLRRIVAPAIAPDPRNVSIRAADWFSFCDAPKWNGISRPRTILLAAGAADQQRNALLDSISAEMPSRAAAASGFTTGQNVSPVQTARLDALSSAQLADLIAMGILPPPADQALETDAEALRRARIGAAADRVARDPEVRRKLAEALTLDAQLRIVANEVQVEVERSDAFVAAGPVGDFFQSLRDRVTESLSRTLGKPLADLTIVAGELRPTLNDFVTRFIGDLLFYMTRRGTATAPGPIPSVLLQELERAQIDKQARDGEPIVLLTHSMGGQIAYDTVTSFMLAANSPIKVDFWCATASQVGFFEELNMFLASSPDNSEKSGRRTPSASSTLGRWWNVWDHNDIISFTTKGIFADGIDDEEFWTGMSVAAAHGGYLERPSFYRRFAEKLEAAFPGRGG